MTSLSPVAHATDYYWVGGTGQWNDLAHWATSSGGSISPIQTPQSTDNVFFDANSFAASNERVTIDGTVTCLDMNWTGAVHALAAGGTTAGAALVGAGSVEVNGDLHLQSGMGRQDANFTLLATNPGHEVDLQAVPLNGWLKFDSGSGGWLLTSDANLVQYGGTPSLLLNAGSIDFGSVVVSCFGVRSTGSGYRDIQLNHSQFNLLSPSNTWEVSGTNLLFDASASILRVGPTPRNTATEYSFISGALNYNQVEVGAGASATFSVAGSSFDQLIINGNTTLTSSATINGSLTVGAEVVLRAAAGQVLYFSSSATLATGGSCAGLAVLQSSVPGKVAYLNRARGWGSTSLGFAAVQDLRFGGGAGGTALPALTCLDRGNNLGISFGSPTVSDLYWVGGAGEWHDARHWATSSGGSAAANTCLPTLTTNVHFDANSFATTGETVTLDGPNAFCRDLDWTGAPASVFSTAGTASGLRQLHIGGSLTLTPALTLNLGTTDLVLEGYEIGRPAATLATAGRVLTGNVYFRAAGSTYTLLDNLSLVPGPASPNGRIYVEAGTLLTAGRDITAQGFTSGYAATGSVFSTGTAAGGPVSLAPVAVDLSTSTLTLTPASAVSDAGVRATYTWDIAAGTSLAAGASTINIGSNATPNQPAYFLAGLGLRYHNVNFTDPAAGSLPTLVAGGAAASFDVLAFSGSADIAASTTITQQLTLAGGRAYTFNSTTQTLAADAQLVARGGCEGFLTISGASAGARAAFNKPAGGPQPNQSLQFALLRNVAFGGGASWTAAQSLDNGGTTGVVFSSPPTARVLYWVGNGGRWSDPSHWALSSGGPGGNCPPNQLDNANFDAQSFSLASQVVTQDVLFATCRSLSWATVTNRPTFSGSSTNKLSLYGSLAWSAAMNQQLAGETAILSTATITSAGQTFGGALTIDAPGATVTLADALQQPRTAGSGLAFFAGTFLTNNQPVRLRSLLSNPQPGAIPPARILRLGTSTVEITVGNWTITQPASLTFDAGTSTILLSTGAFFNGNGFTYNNVTLGPGVAHTVGGNSTFGTLRMGGVTLLTGSNTITQQLVLDPGSTFRFGAGTTTTLAATASVQASGTGTRVITLQSTSNGQAFSWNKPAGVAPAGTVCASYIYLRDSQAVGGAYFEAGQQANNQGNNSGWSFAALPQASYRDQVVCPQMGAHTLRFTFSGFDRTTRTATPLAAAQYPLTVVLRNLTTGTSQTLSVPDPTFDLPIAGSATITRFQVLSVATNPAGCTPLLNSGPFPIVIDGPPSGPAGLWTGISTSSDWLDCQNWGDGRVPTTLTNVTIPAGAAPRIDGPATVANLQVLAGGQLDLGSAADLAISGNWLNEGSTTPDPASQVTFMGSARQSITNGNFGRLVVNNPAGVLLQTNASSTTSLTLTAGRISTGAFRWWHTNPDPASLSSSAGYVAGTLRRSLTSGGTGTYSFPVGTANQLARIELLSIQLAGTSYLDASFGPKTDSDTGLNCTETNPSPLRYRAIYPEGIWTLTPDAQPTGGTYAVQASLAPFSGLVDNTFGLLKRPDNSLSAADWNTGGGTLSPANGPGRRVADGYALRSGLSSFSQFGLGLAEAFIPLPVTLVSFQAALSGYSARLTWTVAQQLGLSQYNVERSLDGRRFERVGQVAATSSPSASYAFTDVLPSQLLNNQRLYYRLQLLELGAPTSYSPVVTLRRPEVASALLAWPTVFSAELNVVGATAGEDWQRLELTDAQGRVVFTQVLLPGSHSAVLQGQGLAPGLYLLRVVTATQIYQQRVVRE
ncbi:T9SS type A sorting domain-containing protein [Hymenobacter sp. BT664]|uniref:T9SS type A sorting domain-containing protein n=1 Tax=Hymenobacter montanus TaxID=2771359 RepID=A0A927GKG9_9BACT|nr:T9SS type A sorting domain-containing protein [Hymenobacter montanus]MBD2769121.1 T9SS type A sorting domain-containing protein [Hymenobacter montanus]